MGKFLIGLCVGVIVAIGVVYYLNNTQSKFTNWYNNPSIKSTENNTPEVLSPDTKIHNMNNSSNTQTDNYDFYQILPTNNNKQLQNEQNIKKDEKNISRAIIQIGPFADNQLAQSTKGKLAFLGYEAKIVNKRDGDNVKLMIVIDSYPSQADAIGVIQNLKANDIEALLLK